MSPIIISIEGNIGSGKSTLLSKLETYSQQYRRNIVFVAEPVDIWTSLKDAQSGENIIEKFYKDPAKYSFPFQVVAYSTRLEYIRNAIRTYGEDCIFVCERSLDADKNVFAKMLFDDGKMEDINYQIYNHFYNGTAQEYPLSGIIYVDAEAEVCHDRIHRRSRDGESQITLDYLSKCKKYHDEWIVKNENGLPIYTIDANPYVSYENDTGSTWLENAITFIDSIVKEQEDDDEWKYR